jgi:large-conductance mechanosensitive channel
MRTLVEQSRFCQSLPGARSFEGRSGVAGRCESEGIPVVPGAFINDIVNFAIIAFVIFLLVVV